MILVSACLLGEDCKYDGGNNETEEIRVLFDEEELISVCPERLGGLTIPRPPAEIQNGTGEDVLQNQAEVRDKEGQDLTDEFLAGARQTLEKAVANDCKLAIFKARSPSCGTEEIYDGSFSGEQKEGVGVTTALLERAGIRVFNEDNLMKVKEAKEELENEYSSVPTRDPS
ncbi:MAG: DUF523 domain-containing protein [Halanaerobacter sp.]